MDKITPKETVIEFRIGTSFDVRLFKTEVNKWDSEIDLRGLNWTITRIILIINVLIELIYNFNNTKKESSLYTWPCS